MKSQSDRIRYLRTKILKLDQARLGKLLGVSRVSVQSWEKRKRPSGMRIENANKLAAETGTTVVWILHGVGRPPVSGESAGRATKDIVMTGNVRSPVSRERPEIPNGQELAQVVIETAFLAMLNRSPTAAERSLLVKSSLELYSARQVLAQYRRRVRTARTPIAIPDRTDGKATEPV